MSTLVVYHYALYRLTRTPKGYNSKLLGSQFTGTPEDDLSDVLQSSIKDQIKAILTRGPKKLKLGKRIKLSNEEEGYEIHILADSGDLTMDPKELESNPEADAEIKDRLIFFVVTVYDYGKHGSIQKLMNHYRTSVLELFDSNGVKFQSAGSQQKRLLSVFSALTSKWAHSQFLSVQEQVKQIKNVMQESVTKALNNVESLEEMEDKADIFKEQAKAFEKKSDKVQTIQKRNYYKLFIILAVVVIGFLAYIIVPIVTKVDRDVADPGVPMGSGSTASASP